MKSKSNRKQERKALIARKKHKLDGVNPDAYFLTVSDEDKHHGRTPNRRKFDFYNNRANFLVDALERRTKLGAKEGTIEKLERGIELADKMASRYASEAF